MDQQRYLISGPIRLDRRDERLWRNGQEVRLGGKALALLRALMERPQTLVTKDQLFESVWPGLAVSESVLTTAVKEIRQALDDDARNPQLIQTVYGRGYRFLPDVQLNDEVASEGQAPLRRSTPWLRDWRIWGGFAALALLVAAAAMFFMRPGGDEPAEATALAAHPKSIAVLPFEDLSPGRDQKWFADGLTEEILNSLARTPDLHVAARTSTMSIEADDIREIGRRLNVAHVLEGSVRRDGDRLRVTAQLIRASDGFHLWSQNYDRPMRDAVSIQEDIAVAIAHALKTVMSPESLQAMVRLGTRSVEAYEEYLKALSYDRRSLETGDDNFARLSAEAFERARAVDPGFAAAQWEAAQYWFGNATRIGASQTERRGTEDQRLKEYLVRVDAAIASSRGRPENFKYRSARALMDLRFREALRLMQLYLRERPRDLDAWEEVVDLAGYAEDRPFMAQAAERIHTLSLEGGQPLSRALTASVLSLDIPNAVRRSREQLRRSPGEALIQYQAHRALLWGGHSDEARAILDRIRSSSLPGENILLAELRQACADGGRGAREIEARLLKDSESPSSDAWHAAILFGDQRRAAEILKPLDRPERLTTLMQYLVYPEFDVLPFPRLRERLRADGIERRPPVRPPFACPAKTA
jgi:TolB-like protein/DNA-binding winged helix-turn-helix (wHTH) protein